MSASKVPAALERYRTIWQRKPVLRLIYDDFYRRIDAACGPGLTLEIGGGIGGMKERRPEVITTDVQIAPWLDCVADAQRLPFAQGTLGNIVMLDALHHLEFPALFFREAERVLRHGGRVVMVEPAITWGSTLFYRLLHHEPVRMSADPLASGAPDPTRDPYDSNQAIPTLITTRDLDRFHHLFPNLRISSVHWFSLLSYPMSGGFKSWSLLPKGAAPYVLRGEEIVEGTIGRFTAFRMMVVVERR